MTKTSTPPTGPGESTVPDQSSATLRVLPMSGLTHGSRSPVTCHLRCGDACAQPAPNLTEHTTFQEVASAALSRRVLIGGALGAALLPATASALPAAAAPASHRQPRTGLSFKPIAPVATDVDDLVVPAGYRWQPIIRWGDPLFSKAPAFDPLHQTPQSQAQQFGYNNDYADIITLSRNKALLVCNHEYTNEWIMFPPGTAAETIARVAWEAHGLSVVELSRRGQDGFWSYERGASRNRRITLTTPFAVDGPAAGSPLLKTAADPTGRRVLGTMNNCAGGTTPWGTVLSGEENFNQYFVANGTSTAEKRYGLGASGDSRGWRTFDPRWDARQPGSVNEPNRFGWVVEVDPMDPHSTPVKHTAMGRFKHEGANVIIAADRRVVAYMGDDERFEYIYKFISARRYDPSPSERARRHNLTLLSEGDLYVARFTGDGLSDATSDGTGQWLQLTRGGTSLVPGMSIDEVLVHTRLAADTVAPTKMDRPEDVEPSLHSRRIYAACTNNTRRTAAQVDEANPRSANKDGHVVEIIEDGNDNTATTFTWNLLLICGDEASAGTYFGGYTGPITPISCPDNVAFDSTGNLWVSTDGAPGTINRNDGLFKVIVDGPNRGKVEQFLAVPVAAETCGPVIHDQDGSVFVAVQHPGEDGTWDAQTSTFPDGVLGRTGKGDFPTGPRPCIVQVRR